MFQIKGDTTGKTTKSTIAIEKYMQIKTTFKCAQKIICDKLNYKSKHSTTSASSRPQTTTQ
eukprot:682050-Amphidinium_carterae.2